MAMQALRRATPALAVSWADLYGVHRESTVKVVVFYKLAGDFNIFQLFLRYIHPLIHLD